jgi:hypothetical protein
LKEYINNIYIEHIFLIFLFFVIFFLIFFLFLKIKIICESKESLEIEQTNYIKEIQGKFDQLKLTSEEDRNHLLESHAKVNFNFFLFP